MNRLVEMFSAVFVYFSVGQTMFMFVGLALLIAKGGLNHEKLLQISAIVQGVNLRDLQQDVDEARNRERLPQPSLRDVAEVRALKARDLELREQELRNQLNLIRQQQSKLVAETDRYQKIQSNFEQRLKMLHTGAIAVNMENARLMLENMKPKQAKEQLQRMLKDGEIKQAVAMVTAMPIEKRAKLAAEFKSDEEAEQLSEILRLIRAGEPDAALVDETKRNLAGPGS